MAPWREARNRDESVCARVGARACARADLKLPPGVELAQTLHGLLAVHHGGHSGTLLQEETEPPFSVTARRSSAPTLLLQPLTKAFGTKVVT